MRAFKIAYCLVCLHLSTPLWAAAAPVPVAGTASIVAGAVSSYGLDGSARVLSKGDAVHSGDRIVTGAAAYVRLGFLDGSSMVLRPNTEFVIEGFRFQPGVVETAVQVVPPKDMNAAAGADAAAVPALQVNSQASVGNQAFFRLVRGGFRAVSGLVGKINRAEYAVRTPVATIGIRGTGFFTVFCDVACQQDPMIAKLLPPGETALGGTVSGVDQGSIVMTSNMGNTVVMETSQFVLTTASGTHVVLPGLPGFLTAENWLRAAQQTTATSVTTATPPPVQTLVGSTLSTVPTATSLTAAILIGVTALATDAGTDAAPSATAPTSTAR